MLCLRFVLIFLGLEFVCCTVKLQEHYGWNVLDFNYPSEQQKWNDLKSRRLIPENNLPVGMEIWRDKMFITVPRWRTGIPSTLNFVPLIDYESSSPKLTPYPDLASNELGNCGEGLSTVYRIKVDQCNRLWVLDTGTFGIGNTTQNPCPYALNIFDLTTDQRIRRYELQTEDTNANTFIANIAVELGSSCEDAHAYLSDELGYGLIVYSFKANKSWRFTHDFFKPDPLRGDFNIAGLNFQWGDEGIFGMSLSPIQPNGFRTLYFSPLASHRQFAVSTQVLQNSSLTENSYQLFLPLQERGPSGHTTARVMTDQGIEFFNLIDQNAIGCWNSLTPYQQDNIDIVDSDEEKLIFPADVKVDTNNMVWVLQDQMSTFLLSNLDYNKINFRIFFAPISVLIENTKCDLQTIANGIEHHHYNRFF